MIDNIDRQHGEVVQSYGRCCLAESFFDTFFDIFFASSEEVAQLFLNTDVARQKRHLKDSLALVIMFSQGRQFATQVVIDLAEKHSSRGLGVKPNLYGYWLDSLIAAVKIHDSVFSAELEDGWRKVLGKAIERMQSAF